MDEGTGRVYIMDPIGPLRIGAEAAMKLTRATNYAVRALVEIARCGSPECADLRSLARKMKAPEAFLAKVFQRLKRAGLVEGTRGAHGGYRLARDAAEMTVRDVVEAIEGRTTLSACLSREDRPGTKPCPRESKCGARRLWSRLEGRLNEVLDSETIGGLASKKRAGIGKRR